MSDIDSYSIEDAEEHDDKDNAPPERIFVDRNEVNSLVGKCSALVQVEYVLKSTADKEREEILKPIREIDGNYSYYEIDKAIREALTLADKP
jgi:hypothetical protein